MMNKPEVGAYMGSGMMKEGVPVGIEIRLPLDTVIAPTKNTG